MKKQMISAFLALTLVLSVLPVTAAAAETEETRCYHLNSSIANAEEATCTAAGYTGDLVCNSCGETLFSGIALPVRNHSYEEGVCTVCGAAESGTPEEEPEETRCYHLDSGIANAEEATCAAPGYTGDLVCNFCGETLMTGLEIPASLLHTVETDEAVEATCTAAGLTEGRHCSVCGEILAEQEEVPALGHSYEAGVCTVCGEADLEYVPETVRRIAGTNRCATAREIADEMKTVLGVEQFDVIVYASGDNFADALAGSYLAVEMRAPILLYRAGAAVTNLNYIRENLAPGGTVYILGGERTIPGTVDLALQVLGIEVQRLGGSSRFGTNLAILEEASFTGGEILVCTSHNFADSLSASASGKPILLVGADWTELSESYVNYLSGKDCTFTIIGGTKSVTAALEADLANYGTVQTRISGANRYLTSVAVAEQFADAPSAAVLAYAQDYPDGLCGGPLAYFLGAPLLLTDGTRASIAADYTAANGITEGIVLGGERLISNETADLIFGK